ncbi:MAG: Na+/H+ antiporter subunit E, partial [candidate division KSB1 bacterium]|nr:Na+/H+ antiporter subunit E [candidate division KSB1 bacterium]
IFLKLPRLIGFLLFYWREIILSNLRIAHDVLTPTHYMKPGVIAIPLEAKTDLEIGALANLISMTPGSLSLDVSTDRRVLYVHAMYLDNPDKLRTEIKDNFEKRILEILR